MGSEARADVLELRNKTTLEGKVLATGPTRILFETELQTLFVDRDQIEACLDDRRRPLKLEPRRVDPVGWVLKASKQVHVQQGDVEVDVSVSGVDTVLWEGGVLRTGPMGRIRFLVLSGGTVWASNDAIVRFTKTGPELTSGTLLIKAATSTKPTLVLLPGGQLEVTEGQTRVRYVGGRSEVQCTLGRSVFVSRSGYRLELAKGHMVYVGSERVGQPPAIWTTHQNRWGLRLRYGGQEEELQPGQRLILLGLPSSGDRPAPSPSAHPVPRPKPRILAGKVVRATGSFALRRAGLLPQRITRSEANGFELLPKDVLETDHGTLHIQHDQARLTLNSNSQASVSAEGQDAPFGLMTGEAVLETGRRATLGFSGGKLRLQMGRATLKTKGGTTLLNVAKGSARAHFGSTAWAELLPRSRLEIQTQANKLALHTPPGSMGASIYLAGLDAQLGPGQRVVYSQMGPGLEVIEFDGSRIELANGVRCRRTNGPDETWLLELADGRSIPLQKGTYRFSRKGDRILAELPSGVSLAEASKKVVKKQPPVVSPTRPVKRLPRGSQRKVLSNGAVVITRNWGRLVVKGESIGGYVTVAGPRGDLLLGANTHITLSRERGLARIKTRDGRRIDHLPKASPFTLKLTKKGKMLIDIELGNRALVVGPGIPFDVTIHNREYVLAYFYGQAFYVEAGQRIVETQSERFKTDVTRKR